MPETDGIELLRLLGKRRCRAGIVLISAVGRRIAESAEQLAQTLDLCIVGHLQKPFLLSELDNVLRSLPASESSSTGHLIQHRDSESGVTSCNRAQMSSWCNQPQINIKTGRVSGVEALVRWQHLERGLIFPESFIGRMEKFGLIDELGWIVAESAMSDVGQFANGDGKALALSLNASVNSLRDLNFPDILVAIGMAYRQRMSRLK
jgi:hypothetical protein